MTAAARAASGWPQWRGPRGDGSASSPFYTGEPADQLFRLWERRIGGGYSGPIVSDGRVWVHSREGEQEVVRALRLADGEVLWRRSYEAPFRQDPTARAHGRGPYSTPSLAAGRLFTWGVNAVLNAWDADTGELLWTRSSGDEFDPAFPYFGAAASPLVWRDRCFVHLGGHEREDLDGPASGAMVALRSSDGRELWRWSGDGPAMAASPVIHWVEGRPHLVFKTRKLMIGLDPLTGGELWRVPFRVAMDNTIVTPLLLGATLMTSDWDQGMLAWQIRATGASWEVRPLWSHRTASLSMSSPVLAGGLLVGFSSFRRGQLFVLDPESGEVLWLGQPRRGEHATLIASGSQVLAIQEDGLAILAEVTRNGLVPIRRYRLGRAVAWSHPAIVGGLIVFRDGDRLAVSRLNP